MSDFVADVVGEDGSFENADEYIRGLIRRDMERADEQTFDRLKAELTQAFSAPDSSYRPLTARDVILRNHG